MDATPSNGTAASQMLASPGSSVICATCRRPLVRPGSQTCAHCLANALLLPDDEPFEDEPPGSEATMLPPRRYGHFEILTQPDGSRFELGHGAMGTTYRAQDTVLHRAVALKVIDRSVAEHPAARMRFLREARAAAQFQHPNVAAVSHYGEQDGECFYAMELVEGETLEARVQRHGPLPATLTLEVAFQVSQALLAAEARGVVHRDLKPTNLMLVTPDEPGEADKSCVIKVIDFGLAKAVTATAALPGATQTLGVFVGTPAFASPEQFGSTEVTRIDHRSDIYSLGVTMWYALTGRAPFPGRSLEEIHARQSDRLPLEQLTARTVPRPVIHLLESMLAVDPGGRPQSARELLDALRACQQQVEAASVRVPRRRSLPWVLATVILMAGAGLAGWWWQHGRTPPLAVDRSIAVLPFENLSASPNDAFFATGMQDEIAADLARVASLKVIGPDSTRGYPVGKRDFAPIGRELGVRHLLEGSVRREGDEVRIEVRLIDTQDAGRPWTAEYRRRPADVFVAQGEVTRAVADWLQTPLSTREKSVLNEPPTTDLEAYELYLRARSLPVVETTTDDIFAVLTKRVVWLEAAVARDPQFVLAYCELSKAHDHIHAYRAYATPEQRTVDHRALADAALRQAVRLRPDAGEVHLATALHIAASSHDLEQTRSELDLARCTLPNSAELEQLAALTDRAQGRWEEAVHGLEKATALEPRDPTYWNTLADTYHLMRRWEDYQRVCTNLQAILPPADAEAFDWRPDVGLERDADLTALRAQLSATPDAGRDRGFYIHDFVLHLFERDADALSRSLASANRATFPINGCVYPRGWYEGLAAWLRGDTAGAQQAFESARVEAEKTLAADPSNGLALSMLAMIDAGLGRNEDATREGRRACELVPRQSARKSAMVRSNLAVVYTWTGQADLAIAELQELVKQPSGANLPIQPSYGDFKLNPAWDPLRGDQRFAALVAQLAPPASASAPPGR